MIYLRLFLTFLKIGAFTFGGGYAMLPFIEQEVLANNWLNMEELLDFVAVAESTPGPFAINIATYVGSEIGGLLGALCATLGVVTPSLVIILLVARWFLKFRESRWVSSALTGIRPVTVGLIAAAALSIALAVFLPEGLSGFVPDAAFLCSIGIFAVTLFLSIKKVSPIIIILGSAAVGVGLGYLGVFR